MIKNEKGLTWARKFFTPMAVEMGGKGRGDFIMTI